MTFIEQKRFPLLVSMLLLFAFAFVWFLFFGPAYSVFSTSSYQRTTQFLLVIPATKGEVNTIIQHKGYISIVETRRIMERAIPANDSDAIAVFRASQEESKQKL